MKVCQEFVNEYTCQDGTLTDEGLMNCNPQHSRVKVLCQQFIDGIADEYGEYISEEVFNAGMHGSYGGNDMREVVIFGKTEPIPADWELVENRYQTPSQQEENILGGIVGYMLKPLSVVLPSDDVITIGGMQIHSCDLFGSSIKYCNDRLWIADGDMDIVIPIYTDSQNQDIISFFNIFAY